ARQAKFTSVFDTTISDESGATDEWALTNGSEYMSGGILSGITGNRANLVVVDDPIKGRQDAESDVIRTRTIEAFDDDVKTRLLPGGSIIIIQCLTGDTKITMAGGHQKRMDCVEAGERVLSWSGESFVASSVDAVIDNGLDQT